MEFSPIVRIAFDTNIWISFSIGKRLDRLKEILPEKRFKIFICPEIIEEYTRISKSQKLKKYLSDERILDTIDLMREFTEIRKVISVERLSRDPGDDFLLAFSKENELNFLITGDTDLLVIKKYHHTQIVNFERFLELVF
jgi:putative PIN family toxin of toxin-antitoxin system